MTYGWAILVVLVAIGLLAYLHAFPMQICECDSDDVKITFDTDIFKFEKCISAKYDFNQSKCVYETAHGSIQAYKFIDE